MGHGVLVLDGQRRVVDANPAAVELLGQQGDLIGLTADEILAELAELIDAGQEQSEVVLSASKLSCEISLLAMDQTQTRRDGYLVMLQDISERKRQASEEVADQLVREQIWAWSNGMILSRCIGPDAKRWGYWVCPSPFAAFAPSNATAAGSAPFW